MRPLDVHRTALIYATVPNMLSEAKGGPMSQKVIYIAGRGHSGSTLLDMVIGSHPNVESVGEVTKKSLNLLFGHDTSLPCTCGRNFSDCAYWSKILKLWSSRGISTPEDLLTPKEPSLTKDAISDILSATNRSIYAESTKSIPRLETLLSTPGLDVHVIHLIRDPRAVALSLYKKNGKLHKPCARLEFYSRQNRGNYAQTPAPAAAHTIRRFRRKSGERIKKNNGILRRKV